MMCRISLRGVVVGVVGYISCCTVALFVISSSVPQDPSKHPTPSSSHQQPMATLASYLGFQTTLFKYKLDYSKYICSTS